MRRAFTAIGVVLVLSSSAAFGQSAGPAPAFDVADVHLRPHSNNPQPFMSGGVLRGGRYDLRDATMLDLIAAAYNVTDTDTIVGGPNWLDRDRFDVAAKAQNGTSPEQLRLMLQQLLAERFKLVLHKDSRPMPGFALTVGKGGKPKMKEAPGEGSGCEGVPQQPQPGEIPQNTVTCKGLSMELFAQQIRGMAGATLPDPSPIRPASRGTGFRFEMDVARAAPARRRGRHLALRRRRSAAWAEARSATRSDPGVHRRQRESEADGQSVRHLGQHSRAAADGVRRRRNQAQSTRGADKRQAAARRQDRSLRRHAEVHHAVCLGYQHGRADREHAEVVRRYQHSIVAKTTTAVAGPANNPNVDIDDLKAMLRALVTDRFKLKAHYADRPVTAYTLLADKPKMAKADPTNRTGFKEGPAPDQKDQRTAILARMVTVKNMTMSQFAEDLQRMANGYIRVPVEDKTGLEGAYDFTLTFTPIGLLNGGPGGGRGGDGPSQGPPGASAAASDPSGGLSLFDEVTKQLGLKLEMRKRTLPVLVIDHVEQNPTDN
jgi:uncharacterized protein (TIGR03435 family)